MLTPDVAAPVDLSREGPFDAFCVPSDTGAHPLILEGLPSCPYRMTSYRKQDIAKVDPAFGVQLHHPPMSAMGLWRPPVGPGVPGPMPGYSYK